MYVYFNWKSPVALFSQLVKRRRKAQGFWIAVLIRTILLAINPTLLNNFFMRIHILQVLDEYKLKFYRLQRKVKIWEKKPCDDKHYVNSLFCKQHYSRIATGFSNWNSTSRSGKQPHPLGVHSNVHSNKQTINFPRPWRYLGPVPSSSHASVNYISHFWAVSLH